MEYSFFWEDFPLFQDIAHFLFVVFPVEDLPFGTTFGNTALLTFDFVAGGLVDRFFLLQPLGQNIDDGEANRVPVFNKLDWLDRRQLFSDLMREEVDLLSAQTHA